MIDEKLFNTLKSLGFTESDLKNRYISKESRDNEFTVINKNILITYISYPPGENRQSHSHEEVRLTFVRSGKGFLKSEGRETQLNPGDISVLLPGVVHSLKVTGENELNICEIVIDPAYEG